jgi:DNA-binding NtrC family response regulator
MWSETRVFGIRKLLILQEKGTQRGCAAYQGMETAKVQHTVLVVEDEVLIRMSSVATLEDAGFRILEAGCSAEAIELLLRHKEIEVLMTDVRLPGEMDGLDLVALVHRFHPRIRSLVVSGNTSVEDACNAGAIGFLPKPYMAHSLVHAVTELIQRNFTPLSHAV